MVFLIMSCEPPFPFVIEDSGEIKTLRGTLSKIESDCSILEQNSKFSLKNDSLYFGASKILSQAEDLVDHIDLIKAKTFSIYLFGSESPISEEVYVNGEFLIGLDSMKSLVGIDNYIINSDLMIGNPNNPKNVTESDGYNYSAEELRVRLISFRELVTSTSEWLDSSKVFKQQVTASYQFPGFNEVSNDEEPWVIKHFYHVPLAASTAMLTTLQARVYSTSFDYLNYAVESIDRKD